MMELRDEFLSDEDLDLRNLSEEEWLGWWDQWLRQAQATNAADEGTYTHGVFVTLHQRTDDPRAFPPSRMKS